MKPRLASAQRRASIVNAAIPLFARKGFAGTTTREIAEAAGVSEALVFKYFASKTALYEAILAACDRANPAFERLTQLPPGTDALVAIVRTLLTEFTAVEHRSDREMADHRLFLRSLLEDGEFARAVLRVLGESVLPLFAASYHAARRAGDLVADAPAAEAAFWFMVQGPLMLGTLALSRVDTAMSGFSRPEVLRGLLRGIGLNADVIAAHCDARRTAPHQAELTAIA